MKILQVFTSLALFNILISPLNAFPWVINGLMEAWVSIKRVNAFLQLEELSLTKYYCQGIASPDSRGRLCNEVSKKGTVNASESSYHYCSSTDLVSGEATTHAVSIHGGSFTWTREEDESSPDTPHPASTASARGDEDSHARSKNMASAGGGQDTIEDGQDARIPWGLTDINITIKPVSSTLTV